MPAATIDMRKSSKNLLSRRSIWPSVS
jgi:hypothetical protein